MKKGIPTSQGLYDNYGVMNTDPVRPSSRNNLRTVSQNSSRFSQQGSSLNLPQVRPFRGNLAKGVFSRPSTSHTQLSDVDSATLVSGRLMGGVPTRLLYQPMSQQRHWMQKRGKARFVDFTSDELVKLRKYFKELDDDGSGSIGIEELEQPLLSLGLCKNKQEVADLFAAVDEDGSGEIEFSEFLNIIKHAAMGSKEDRREALKQKAMAK